MNIDHIRSFLRDSLGLEVYPKRRFIYNFPSSDSQGDEFEPDIPEYSRRNRFRRTHRRMNTRKRRSH